MIRSTLRSVLLSSGAAMALVLGLSAPAASAAAPVRDVRGGADHIMGLGYAAFADYPRVGPYDWSTDGCSAPPVLKGVVEGMFLRACVQHDFGYRNYGARPGGLRLSPVRETKDWIDGLFWSQMRELCADRYGGAGWCLASARLTFEFVHRFGDGDFWSDGTAPREAA